MKGGAPSPRAPHEMSKKRMVYSIIECISLRAAPSAMGPYQIHLKPQPRRCQCRMDFEIHQHAFGSFFGKELAQFC
jgi:hypothetical protein